MVNRKSIFIAKRLASDKYEERFCVQGGGGLIGIWGCISHKGIGFQNIYTGRINQYIYKKTLENKLLPTTRPFFGKRKSWIFQQDGATVHTANSVKKWFQR